MPGWHLPIMQLRPGSGLRASWAIEELAGERLVATGTTGRLLAERTGLCVEYVNTATLGLLALTRDAESSTRSRGMSERPDDRRGPTGCR